MGRPKKTPLETAVLEATGQLEKQEETKETPVNLSRLAFSVVKKGQKYNLVVIKFDPETGETSEAVFTETDGFADAVNSFKLNVTKARLLLPQE